MRKYTKQHRDTGKFKVPKNEAGLYMFTFSITMDTADFIYEPSEYKFFYDTIYDTKSK